MIQNLLLISIALNIIFYFKISKMPQLSDFQAQITAAETALATISDTITKLNGELSGSLNATDAQTALTALTDLATKLQAIANPTTGSAA